MKKELTLRLVVVFLLVVCDVPALSESEDPYCIYGEYIDSLHVLQQDLAHIHLEINQEKNLHAVYEHALQAVESTAKLTGKAELASRDINDGLQISLRSHLELLNRFGLYEEQKKDLINLGYSERDINKLLDSLLYYNDYYYHATAGFSAEQMEFFYSMGLTDDQISEIQANICYRYTQVHRYQQIVKHHQEELLYIQTLLSLITMHTLLEQDHQKKGKDNSNELKDLEEKLLGTILSVSEDQKSLEHVKSISKHVYKEAERKIREGEEQYFLDFFIGLQIHCGALAALHGDPEFGVAEIRLYEDLLSECVKSSERPILSSMKKIDQDSPPNAVPITNLIEQTEDSIGQIEESDETNNRGWIVLIIKTSDTSSWDFVNAVFSSILEKKIVPDTIKWILVELLASIGVEEGFAAAMGSIGATVFSMIIFAPQAGGGWIESIQGDPSGTFEEIIIDEKTIEYIEMLVWSNEAPCVTHGYWHAIFPDSTLKFAEAIWQTRFLYRSPWGFYYYYSEFLSGEKWVVVVENREYGLGRVVEAFEVICTKHTCNIEVFDTIIEKWECENFALVWSESRYSFI